MAPVIAASRISDFSLLDQNGKFHQLSYYKKNKAVALFVYSPQQAPEPVLEYQRLSADYRDQGLVFTLFNPAKVESRQAFKKILRNQGITLPVLIDDTGLVGETLAISRAGEVLLIDPDRQNIIYRGPFGPSLLTAVEQLAAGKPVSPAEVSLASLVVLDLKGTKTTSSDEDLSYSKDVAPILIKNCLGCHRDGGVAPFAMDSWGVVLGWSPMIREVLLTKRMPPGQIDPTIGQFKNSRVLSDDDISKLIHWIDSGGANNGGEDPLEAYAKPTQEWAFDEPDLVVDLPAQTIPATGLIDYTDLVLPVPLEQDIWVRATQFVPGDRRVLHHAEAFVVSPESVPAPPINAKALIAENFLSAYTNHLNPDTALIAPYVPGLEPEALPDNTGGLIKKNSYLAVQLHYAAIGREVSDLTRLGLWFYDDNNRPEERMTVGCTCLEPEQWQIIPAYDANFSAEATLTIEQDVHLYNILPQMHYRGSAIRFDAHLPNGDIEPLLNIPRYNYNWQIDYQFAEPKFLPAGTKIIASAIYDNSNNNAFNPDASQDVPWGRESFNEILAGVFQWKVVD